MALSPVSADRRDAQHSAKTRERLLPVRERVIAAVGAPLSVGMARSPVSTARRGAQRSAETRKRLFLVREQLLPALRGPF